MKKLMIAAAIVCVAVASQAASFKWKTSSAVVKDINDLAGYNGTATLYAYLSTDSADKAFVVDSASMVAGQIAVTPAFTDAKLVAGNTYTFYYTLKDAAGNTYKSDVKDMLAQADSTPTISIKPGAWTAAPIPEPTSGLLLLLGVAGMALRRRRA